jgi:hypothetical protein
MSPVDDINAEMLVNEFGLAREQVRVVYNAVDLSRLPTRTRALPARPERALVFVKVEAPYLDAVRRACSKRNIVAEFIGYPIGRRIPILSLRSSIATWSLALREPRSKAQSAARP